MIVAVARRLGCTEGQIYTLVIGLAVALPLTLTGTHGTRVEVASGVAANLPVAAGAPGGLTYPGAPVVKVPPPSATSTLAPGSGPSLAAVPTVPGPPSPSTDQGAGAARSPVSIGPALFARIGRPGAPGGIASAPDGQVFVSTNNGTAHGLAGPSMMFSFSQSGQQQAAVGIPGQQPNHADGLGAVAYDPTARLAYALDLSTPGQVVQVDPAGKAAKRAVTVPDVLPCGAPLGGPAPTCEPGTSDHKPALSALVVDQHGGLLIADAGQGTIWRWSRGQAAPVVWYQSSDFATGDGPAGLAFAGPGKLLLTVGSTMDKDAVPVPPDPTDMSFRAALYSFEVSPAGAAGVRSLVTTFASSAKPGALTVDGGGIVYLIQRGPGTIVWMSGSAITAFTTTGTAVPLDGPSGLAVSGGRLLVTNQSASNKAAHWAVLSYPLIGG